VCSVGSRCVELAHSVACYLRPDRHCLGCCSQIFGYIFVFEFAYRWPLQLVYNRKSRMEKVEDNDRIEGMREEIKREEKGSRRGEGRKEEN
jgi:hypothetical protein